MNTQIQVYNSPEFGEIRTMVMPDGQVGFVGKDVARVLGYRDTVNALKLHVEDEDKARWQITTQFGVKEATFINESGLYALILSSKLPKAREFKHWVTSEVLPQIRRTGGYNPANAGDSGQRQLMEMLRSPEGMLAVCKAVVELDDKVRLLSPKAEFADAVMASGDTCTVAELAKMIYDMGVQIGQNRLFAWLRDNHYLGSSEHHWNVPQQKWVEAGLFKVKVSNPWYDNEGKAHYNVTPLVTGKGQQYFVGMFLR